MGSAVSNIHRETAGRRFDWTKFFKVFIEETKCKPSSFTVGVLNSYENRHRIKYNTMHHEVVYTQQTQVYNAEIDPLDDIFAYFSGLMTDMETKNLKSATLNKSDNSDAQKSKISTYEEGIERDMGDVEIGAIKQRHIENSVSWLTIHKNKDLTGCISATVNWTEDIITIEDHDCFANVKEFKKFIKVFDCPRYIQIKCIFGNTEIDDPRESTEEVEEGIKHFKKSLGPKNTIKKNKK